MRVPPPPKVTKRTFAPTQRTEAEMLDRNGKVRTAVSYATSLTREGRHEIRDCQRVDRYGR